MASTPIGRDKLHAAIRKMGNQYVLFLPDAGRRIRTRSGTTGADAQ
jgi:hypothetical protein